MKKEVFVKITVDNTVFLNGVFTAAVSKGIRYGLDIRGVAPPDKVIVEIIEPPAFNDSFVLPERWCVTTTPKINDKLKAWAIANHGKSETATWSVGNHYCYDSNEENPLTGRMHYAPKNKVGYTEITPDQFLQYVLKEEPQPAKWRVQPKTFDEWCQVVKWAVEKTGNKTLEGYTFHPNVGFNELGEYKPVFDSDIAKDLIPFDKFLEYTKK